MRKYLWVFMVLVVSGSAALTAAPAHNITQNCVLFLQAERIQDAVRQVASYAAYTGKQVDADALLNRVSLQLFGRGGFPGLDLTRPIAVYYYVMDDGPAFGARGKRPDIALTLPLSSRATFQQVVAPRLMLMGMQIRYLGNTALLASSGRALNEYQQARKVQAFVLRDAQLSMYVNVQKLQPTIQKVMKKSLAQAGPLASLMKGVLDLYMALIRDTLSGAYSVNLDRDGLEGGVGMAFVRGSDIARALSANRSDALRILSVVPRESIAVFAGSADPASSGKLLGSMVDRFTAFPSLQALLRPLVSYLQENSTGKSALAMLPEAGMGMSFAAVSGIKSAGRSRDFLARMASSVNGLAFLRKLRARGIRLQVAYEKEVRTVAGKQVDTFRLKVTTPAPVPEDKRAMFDMVMRLFTANIVYAGGYEIMVFGESPDVWLRKMIRNTAGGDGGFKNSAAWTRFNRRYGRYPKNGMFFLSFDGFVKEVKEILKATMGARAAMLDMFSIPGALYGYSYSANSRVEFRLLLERETIAGLIRLGSMFLPKQKEPDTNAPD